MDPVNIAKIASEAIKPFSSVIDALLGPKLKRVKNWAEDKDIENHLGKPIVDVLLDKYMRRLLRRICGITTIVFQEQVLPLTSIYEPLYLDERYRGQRSKESQFNIGALEAGHNFLIVDSAGMGKSTFAKHLALDILNSTTKIPIFFELRRISETESLVEKLALDIDEKKKDIDDKLLLMLLDLGNFVIILDGYDEISEQYREKIGRQLTELTVRYNKNSMILTARPEVNLPEIPESKIFIIRPLNREQAESLVLRYDAVANTDIGKRLINEFDAVPERFLETPLLIALLYRTFGFNQSVATKISSFYDDLYNALYKGHDLTKAGFARIKNSKLDSEDFRRLLRGFSFLLAAHQKNNLQSKTEGVAIVEEAIKLTSVTPVSSDLFFDDLLIAVPMLIKDGTDFRFIHKSINEFFAAEFLAYQPHSEQIIERIRGGSLAQIFANSFEYLAEINPSLFRRAIAAPLAKKVLADENPIADPYLRSICFLGAQVFLSLWPGSEKENGREVDPRSGMEFDTIYYFHGSLEGTDYYLAMAISDLPMILSPSVWEQITTEMSKFSLLADRLYNFDELKNNFLTEKWIPIKDIQVLDNVNHEAISDALKCFLCYEDFTSELVAKYNGRSLRIIDKNSCENLLQQIQQEDETRNWLANLISGGE